MYVQMEHAFFKITGRIESVIMRANDIVYIDLVKIFNFVRTTDTVCQESRLLQYKYASCPRANIATFNQYAILFQTVVSYETSVQIILSVFYETKILGKRL